MENLPERRQPDIQLLISQGMEKGLDTATMRELLDMAKEMQADFAREQFNAALSLFQLKCPIINKTKEVRDSQNLLLYKFAPLDSIIRQIGPLLHACGFTYSFDTILKEQTVEGICIVEHLLGHRKVSKVETPYIGKTRAMSEAQQVIGTQSLVKRHAFLNAFGILTAEEEPEAKVEEREPRTIGPKPVGKATQLQIETIEAKARVAGFSIERVLEAFKVEGLEGLNVAQAEKVIARLQNLIVGKLNRGI